MWFLIRPRQLSQRTPSTALADSSAEEVIHTLDHPDPHTINDRSSTNHARVLNQRFQSLSNIINPVSIVLPKLSPSVPRITL